MGAELLVPPKIEEVIARFDETGTPLTESEVQQALGRARATRTAPTDAENPGAWVELLAFALRAIGRRSSNQWLL